METAQEAIMRAAGVAQDAVRAEAARAALAAVKTEAGDQWLKTPDELEPGEYVRCCGDWYRFEGLLPDGKMRLFVDDAEFHYGPTTGEKFVYHLGAF